ncbi:MAG TPA: ATPase, T2SS/T4P/T4SS family [Tepidisphaeraceae bacterium]|jgi:general secretion pathway protein E|nr:ATPase, T2SS/T4P/T4SS family [Tepidisphaeraceae bacterium]
MWTVETTTDILVRREWASPPKRSGQARRRDTSMQEPYVEIHEAGNVRQLELGNDPLTIGRHRDNRLVLGDNLCSRFHCIIAKARKGYIVRDLNSSNGTLVNGSPTRLAPLMNGDRVTIGQVRIFFHGPDGEGVREPDRRTRTVPLNFPPAKLRDDQAEPAPEPEPDDGPIPMEPLPLADAPRPHVDLDAIGDFEPVQEDEVAEPLSEADIIIEPEGSDGPLPMDDPDSIPMEPDDSPTELIGGLTRDPVEQVEGLVNSLPDKSFGEPDIALISARGQLMHAATGTVSRSGQRDAVDWLRLLLLLCARSRATDVHIEPKGNAYTVRTRVDGSMVEICHLSNALGTRLSALVKVLSEIDITQKNTIQEGHFSARVPSGRRGETRRIDYRLSFAPAVFGQKLVVRVLDASYAPLSVGSLGLTDWMGSEVERVIQQDAGMVLVCGPTGSGKTTTLYALIRGSDVTRRNVVTIEDPVEIQLEHVTQIPVDDSQGKSFSNLLRSTLRQDPDVILIGEIRDAETARIAMQAAITGHLVFSTLHTQNTIGTVFRLLDLGAEPYLVSQALHLVLAQRLVRQLCQYCKLPVKPTDEQLARMGPAAEGIDRIFAPRGCARCLNTGFLGRRAIFELLCVNDEFRDLITKTATAAQMQAVISKTKFDRLQESGFQLVAQGISPFEEIDRAVGRER